MKVEEKKQMAEAVLQMIESSVMAYIEAKGDDKPVSPPRKLVRGLEVNVPGSSVAQHCRDKGTFFVRYAKQVQASDLSEAAKKQTVERCSRRARFWLLFADGLDEEADYMLSFEEMEMIVGSGESPDDEPDLHLTTLDA